MRLPSGPSWPTLLGHYLGVLPDKPGFLRRCVREHGDVVDLSLASPLARTYLLNNPDDIGHVLQAQHQKYAKTTKLTGTVGRQRSGEGLLTGMGQPAIVQKRLLQPLLLKAAAPSFDRMIVECAREMLERWERAGEVDLAAEMTALARRIIGRALLSADFEGGARELAGAVAVRQRYIRHVYETRLPFAERLPTRIRGEERRAVEIIDRALYAMIAERRSDPTPPSDLLTMFVGARYADGSAMTDKQVRDEAVTILSTGYETVAIALAWALYLLARHPDARRRLTDEARALGGSEPAAAELPRLPYAEMVFSEAMRLYPPTWIFVRVPEQDDVLPSGVAVRAGTKLYLSPYVTQRDARHFPEPDLFRPERFAESSEPRHHRFAYFPFASGPRVCLGQAFATLEGILVLASVARRFTWDLPPGPPIEPFPGQFLFPRGPIRARVTPHAAAS